MTVAACCSLFDFVISSLFLRSFWGMFHQLYIYTVNTNKIETVYTSSLYHIHMIPSYMSTLLLHNHHCMKRIIYFMTINFHCNNMKPHIHNFTDILLIVTGTLYLPYNYNVYFLLTFLFINRHAIGRLMIFQNCLLKRNDNCSILYLGGQAAFLSYTYKFLYLILQHNYTVCMHVLWLQISARSGCFNVILYIIIKSVREMIHNMDTPIVVVVDISSINDNNVYVLHGT